MASTTNKIKNGRLSQKPYWEHDESEDIQTKSIEYLDIEIGDNNIMVNEENETQDEPTDESKDDLFGSDDFDFKEESC